MTNLFPLSSAIRSNLQALKNTQNLIDETVLRLATGLDVSSPLDNPQNFFAARSLNDRANDLNRRLDGMTQAIRALEETNHGIEASLELIDLLETYLLDALEQYKNGETELQETINGIFIRPDINDFSSYVASQDVGGPFSVTNNGNDIAFTGSHWKQLLIDYTVTTNTYLNFEYASTTIPEIVSIGFDNDSNFNNSNDRFFLYGTQVGGIPYAAPRPTYEYSGSGAYESYAIPIGTFFTGHFDNLTLISDDDLIPTGNSFFRNITITEGPQTIELFEVEKEIEGLSTGYSGILEQLDMLVEDTSYRGTQLLKSEDLTVLFNEDGSNNLRIDGIDGTSTGLGLTSIDLFSTNAVEARLEEVRAARETLRRYASSIASDLNIITTREEFTRNTINTLRRGADDLTLADQNETGAFLLALQTRQTLSQTALSLAAQSQSATLNLFA